MTPSAIVDPAPVGAQTVHVQGQDGKAEVVGFDYNTATSELGALALAPTFESVDAERAYLKERLAAAIRIFAQYELDHGGAFGCHLTDKLTVAGHLTVRDPGNPHHFWVNPFGLAFRLMTVSDLILVDQDGCVIGGGKPGRRVVNLAGFQIHSAIHKARPEVQAICHSHSLYGKAFSTLGKPLAITTQDACALYQDCALLTEFGGVVITSGESNAIAVALGQKKAIILQNHGILSVGTTIDSALAWFLKVEMQCEVQLTVDAAGTTIPIDVPQAVFSFKQVGHERAGYFFASPYFQVIDHLQGEEYRK